MNLNDSDLIELCEVAKKAAISAGKYVQSQFDTHHQKQLKQGGNSIASRIVTNVDLISQEIILNELNDSILKYDLGLLAEEKIDDRSRLLKNHFWSIDPLDGTLPFTEGNTGYAVTVSLISKQGDPLIGIVYRPDCDECCSSIAGNGVFVNDVQFVRDSIKEEDILQVYFDRSMRNAPHFKDIVSKLEQLKNDEGIKGIQFNYGFGAVCNALSVMTSNHGCYFKFPKETEGGGCIWDYAATRLFFDELNLEMTDAFGNRLNLNSPENLFMNTVGVIYSSNKSIYKFIRSLM